MWLRGAGDNGARGQEPPDEAQAELMPRRIAPVAQGLSHQTIRRALPRCFPLTEFYALEERAYLAVGVLHGIC
jgi:hypothetical protein